MKKALLSVLMMFLPFAAAAQMPPPVCEGDFLYVQSYGPWILNGTLWSYPFICSNGLASAVVVATENVENVGLAEYTVQSQEVADGRIFFFTGPCVAMNRFCRYAAFGDPAVSGGVPETLD